MLEIPHKFKTIMEIFWTLKNDSFDLDMSGALLFCMCKSLKLIDPGFWFCHVICIQSFYVDYMFHTKQSIHHFAKPHIKLTSYLCNLNGKRADETYICVHLFWLHIFSSHAGPCKKGAFLILNVCWITFISNMFDAHQVWS